MVTTDKMLRIALRVIVTAPPVADKITLKRLISPEITSSYLYGVLDQMSIDIIRWSKTLKVISPQCQSRIRFVVAIEGLYKKTMTFYGPFNHLGATLLDLQNKVIDELCDVHCS